MTLYGLLAALAWAALAAFVVFRADTFAHRWLDRVKPEHRSLSIEVPDDLVGMAMQESDRWAQDQTLEAIRERYEKLQDWNKVRAAFSLGAIK